ncbi:MAG: hypothetical protein U1F34_08935 [Gammaproteobacteria bacterium]
MSKQFIEVAGPVQEKTSKKGAIYRVQECALFTDGDAYPRGFQRFVRDGEPPLAKGRYQIDIERLYLDREGNLQAAMKFTPMAAGVAAPGSRTASERLGA